MLEILLAAATALQEPGAPAVEPPEEPGGPALVFRVDRVETLDGAALERATLVVRGGVIERMGEAVVLPERAKVHDLRGGRSTALPPLVVPSASFLVREPRGSGRNGRFRAVDSLWLREEDLPALLAQGVLLLGVDPPGSGIPGRTSVLEATAAHPRPLALVSDLHLKITLASEAASVELLRKALKDADEAIEKEKKAREEWEQARKAWEERQKAKEQEKKQEPKPEGQPQPPPGGQEERKEEEKPPPEKFEPPPIDPNLQPVVEWVRKQRVAQVWVADAAAWLHFLDVVRERDLAFEVVLSEVGNFHEVAAALGERKLRVAAPARIGFLPNTRIRVNLPAELAAAGARLVLSPPAGPGGGPEWDVAVADMMCAWRTGLADLVREGLDRGVALRAVTLEPAAAMGQEERVAPLKAGGPATFVVLDGDLLDATARVRFVLDRGEVVYDRDKALERERRKARR